MRVDLPAPLSPQQAHHLGLADAEVDAGERRHGPEVLLDPGHLDEGCGHGSETPGFAALGQRLQDDRERG